MRVTSKVIGLFIIIATTACTLRPISVRAVATDVGSPTCVTTTAFESEFQVPTIDPQECGASIKAPVSLSNSLDDQVRVAEMVDYLAAQSANVCQCLIDAREQEPVAIDISLPQEGGRAHAQPSSETAVGLCVSKHLELSPLRARVTPISIHYEYALSRTAAAPEVSDTSDQPILPAPSVVPPADALHSPSGNAYEILEPSAPMVAGNDQVKVIYRGWNEAGELVAGGESHETVAFADLRPALAESVRQMREGERFRIYVPADDTSDAGAMVFEIELLAVVPPHTADETNADAAVSIGQPAAETAITSVADGQGIVLAVDLGYSRVLNGNGVGGFGFDASGGYALGNGWIPEAVVGYHAFSVGPTSTGIVPFLLGTRYVHDTGTFVGLFAGAHLGLGHISVSTDPQTVTVGGVSTTVTGVNGSTTDFATNFGAGATFQLGSSFNLSSGLWYWLVFTEGESTQMLTIGLDLRWLL